MDGKGEKVHGPQSLNGAYNNAQANEFMILYGLYVRQLPHLDTATRFLLMEAVLHTYPRHILGYLSINTSVYPKSLLRNVRKIIKNNNTNENESTS